MKLLEKVRVLDLTNVLSGPFCTMHLALLGAEVIKIENPEGGDLARKLGNVNGLNKQLMGTSFLAQNANKKSLTLNLKFPEAKEVFRKLAKTADVVVENFRPGVMARLGFSYEELAKINPRLVYCAISGFGQSGPDAFKPAYDQIIQGLSGVMAVNGDERLNPLRAGFPVCDTVGGLNAAFAIMAALFHRERSGEGIEVDVSLLGNAAWIMAPDIVAAMTYGFALPQSGMMGSPNPLVHTYMASDGKGVVLMMLQAERFWPIVAQALGCEALLADPRFDSPEKRQREPAALVAELTALFATRPRHEWAERLNASECIWAPLQSPAEIPADPQVVANGYVQVVTDAEGRDYDLVGAPAQFDGQSHELRPAPGHGEHTDEVLLDLGYTWDELIELKVAGTVT